LPLTGEFALAALLFVCTITTRNRLRGCAKRFRTKSKIEAGARRSGHDEPRRIPVVVSWRLQKNQPEGTAAFFTIRARDAV